MNVNESIEFPFKCGKALVFQDHLVITTGIFKKSKIEIPFEKIKSIHYANKNHWIEPFEGKAINLGSPFKKQLEQLKKLWFSVQIEILASNEQLSGENPGAVRSDKWLKIPYTALAIGLILWVIKPWNIVWNNLDRPMIVIYSLMFLGLGSFAVMGIATVFNVVKEQEYWKGKWQIDRSGFCLRNSSESIELISVSPNDGIIDMSIRYGGKKIPTRYFKPQLLVETLLAHHLIRANASIRLSSFLPRIVMSLSVPLLLAIYWKARSWANFPIDAEEITKLVYVGIGSVVVMLGSNLYLRSIAKKWQIQLIKRVEEFRLKTGW